MRRRIDEKHRRSADRGDFNVNVTDAVNRALEVVPDDARTAPARELAGLLAERLDGEDLSATELAQVSRELRQVLNQLLGSGPAPDDGWAGFLDEIGEVTS
jgi:hypothetical protein